MARSECHTHPLGTSKSKCICRRAFSDNGGTGTMDVPLFDEVYGPFDHLDLPGNNEVPSEWNTQFSPAPLSDTVFPSDFQHLDDCEFGHHDLSLVDSSPWNSPWNPLVAASSRQDRPLVVSRVPHPASNPNFMSSDEGGLNAPQYGIPDERIETIYTDEGYYSRQRTDYSSHAHDEPNFPMLQTLHESSTELQADGLIRRQTEDCQWPGKTKSDCKRHSARHTLPHVCIRHGCGRGFATINDLLRHESTVHNLRSEDTRVYRCFGNACKKPEKDWPRKDNFRSHLKNCHSQEDADLLLRKSNTWWDRLQHKKRNTRMPTPMLRDWAGNIKHFVRPSSNHMGSSNQVQTPNKASTSEDVARRRLAFEQPDCVAVVHNPEVLEHGPQQSPCSSTPPHPPYDSKLRRNSASTIDLEQGLENDCAGRTSISSKLKKFVHHFNHPSKHAQGTHESKADCPHSVVKLSAPLISVSIEDVEESGPSTPGLVPEFSPTLLSPLTARRLREVPSNGCSAGPLPASWCSQSVFPETNEITSQTDRSSKISMDSTFESDGERSFVCGSDDQDNLSPEQREQFERICRLFATLNLRRWAQATIASRPTATGGSSESSRPYNSQHATTSSSVSSLPSGKSSKKRSRVSGNTDEPEEPEEGRNKKKPRNKRDNGPPNNRVFACPYHRYDAQRYSDRNIYGCSTLFLRTIARLKQHLYRVHRRPAFYCGRCNRVFKLHNELNAHLQQSSVCERADPMYEESMDRNQEDAIKRRRGRYESHAEWFSIYRILFPNAPTPPSSHAYAGDQSSAVVQNFIMFFADEAAASLSSFLRQQIGGAFLPSQTHDFLENAHEIAVLQLVTFMLARLENPESMTLPDELDARGLETLAQDGSATEDEEQNDS